MIPGPPFGPGVTAASPEAVLAALERFDPGAPWQAVGPLVLPMLPRLRPYPVPMGDRVAVTLPPGIEVGFGMDLGPALAFVAEPQLAGWGIDRASLVAMALDNVRRLARGILPDHVFRSTLEGVPLQVLQTGLGIGSTLLLVPETLPGVIGAGPHLLAAPMRDILVAMPASADPDFAEWLAEDLAAMDPNGLHLGLFRHERGRVARVSGHPNPLDPSGMMH